MNAVIISKNKEIRIEIAKYIKEKCSNDNILYFIDFKDIAYNFSNECTPHIIFIDIENKNVNLQKLCSDITINNKMAKIVLICPDDYYAVKAFELGVFYYIVKPIKEEQMLKVLNKWEKFGKHQNCFNVKCT